MVLDQLLKCLGFRLFPFHFSFIVPFRVVCQIHNASLETLISAIISQLFRSRNAELTCIETPTEKIVFKNKNMSLVLLNQNKP